MCPQPQPSQYWDPGYNQPHQLQTGEYQIEDDKLRKYINFYTHHISCVREADSHPSLCISLYVDVQEPSITSVGVNANVELTFRWSTAGRVTDPQTIFIRSLVL